MADWGAVECQTGNLGAAVKEVLGLWAQQCTDALMPQAFKGSVVVAGNQQLMRVGLPIEERSDAGGVTAAAPAL